MTRHQRAGFTLVELLVATFILGIILAGLFALTRSTLRYTSLSRAVSTSIEDVSDTEGYLADTLRNAKAVFTSATVPGFSCVNTTDPAGNVGRCIAAVTPVLGDTVDEPIENFDLSVFAVMPIGSAFEAQGIERGWDGTDTLAIFEYRVRNICTEDCSVVPAGANVSTESPVVGFLLGGLSGVDAVPSTVTFFDVPDEADYSVSVTIVARAAAQAAQPFVISETPVSLQVSVRR